MTVGANGLVQVDGLLSVVSAMFVACGVEPRDASIVAEDLVAADAEGVPSHGVMLVPMYVDRLKAGSVSRGSEGQIVSDNMTAVVINAGDILGQLTARQAVELAISRARIYGMGAVAVRNAFHFGAAGRYARMIADGGAVGIVMSNTRPLMPAPGGAQALTGNNPLAIAVPSNGDFHPEVDMALSAVAMGKIRNAAAAGQVIPEGWAVDKDGAATTDPQAAISGMLLPAAGPKGYGLAFLVDLMTGGLSGGAIGAEVSALYGDPATPYRCSNLFIAIDVGHFGSDGQFERRAQSEVERVRKSRKASGVDRVFAPGEMAYAARAAAGGHVKISPAAWTALAETAGDLGVDVQSCFKRGKR
ncbi:Ldh family oxidoreductase [Ensifer sp. ENS05]|uniref:Ldh family oxidoreductase n=1 Tax=Ensifer sp. ENS05 TaxID=2769277 RepID=UPI00177C837E|nr:Ldh family oxidoreductase [Ensifer sp. ENS05]MBD9597410.1 Ldh family oxidoreductase [Ensifer sp. ENS05]